MASSMETINHSYAVFKANKDKLLHECNGKYVVVVGEVIKEKRYDTFQDALEDARKAYGLGNFIIQHVSDSVNFSYR